MDFPLGRVLWSCALHWFRSPRSPWRPRPRSPREAL